MEVEQSKFRQVMSQYCTSRVTYTHVYLPFLVEKFDNSPSRAKRLEEAVETTILHRDMETMEYETTINLKLSLLYMCSAMTHLLHVVCDHAQQGVAKMAKMTRFVETDLQTRIYRVTSGINESITVAANEPSVGLFRLQEHVVGTVPKLVSERLTMDDIAQRVQGANFDIKT